MSTETMEMVNGVATGNRRLPTPGIGQGVSKLASDLLTLAELQWRLFVIDARQTLTRSNTMIGLFAGATVLAVAAASVAVAGVGIALAYAIGWPVWAGLLASAILALVFSAILVASATRLLKSALSVFTRSRDEFAKNLETFKSSLSTGESSNLS